MAQGKHAACTQQAKKPACKQKHPFPQSPVSAHPAPTHVLNSSLFAILSLLSAQELPEGKRNLHHKLCIMGQIEGLKSPPVPVSHCRSLLETRTLSGRSLRKSPQEAQGALPVWVHLPLAGAAAIKPHRFLPGEWKPSPALVLSFRLFPSCSRWSLWTPDC